MQSLLGNSELAEFLAQGTAVDAENGGRTALIALNVAHDHFEQRLFHFAHHEVVQVHGFMAVERFKITLQRLFGLGTQRPVLAVDLQVATVERRPGFSTRFRFLFGDHGLLVRFPADRSSNPKHAYAARSTHVS